MVKAPSSVQQLLLGGVLADGRRGLIPAGAP
jgi:hypothetical protein